MRHPTISLAAILALSALVMSADALKRDFESDAVGAPPAGFEFARTGGGA